MNLNEIESRLTQLGENWPVASIAESVSSQLDALPVPEMAKPRSHRLQWTLAGSVLTLIVAVSVVWLTTLSTPTTLAAQLKDAIQKSNSVHVLITTIDAKGNRFNGEVWYSRAHGFRLESSDENIVDDGKQQWTWNPSENENKRVVYRRASHVDASMIMDMTGLDALPAEWQRSRVEEFDRDIGGKHCEAHLVEPKTTFSVAYGDSSPSPMRMIVWVDQRHRIVSIDTQHRTNDQWQVRREMSVEYDVEMSADKFAVTFPPTIKIVDADSLWSTRFPLDKSLATVESDGLLFAVHEAIRCEGDIFYIVSSVRGTSDFLKKYPPKRRQFNLHRSILEVAQQRTSAGPSGNLSHAILTSAELEGVQYLWWIAIPRKTYYMKDGVRTLFDTPTALEPEPGRVRVELSAIYRDPRAGNDWVNTHLDLNLPADRQPESLVSIAGRARRDALLDSDGLNLYGEVKEGTQKFLRPASVTDAQYANAFQSQIDWLHSFDTVLDEAPIQVPTVNYPARLPAKIEGRIIDDHDKPVANATVTVRIQRWHPYVSPTDSAAPKPWIVTTNNEGYYEFFTDEPSMNSSDELTIHTQADNFPIQRAIDYSLQVLSGTFPTQRLFTGRTIKGRIADPNGKPMARAVVRFHSNSSPSAAKSNMNQMWDSGPLPVDEAGAFRLMIPVAIKAAFEIYPHGYAPQVLEIPEGDVDLGMIRVQKGTSLTGRVVDKNGTGIAGTVVAIQSQKMLDLFLLGILNATAVKTDETGRFTLPPFRGKCVVSVTDGAPDYSQQFYIRGTKPLSIPSKKLELTGEVETMELNFRE